MQGQQGTHASGPEKACLVFYVTVALRVLLQGATILLQATTAISAASILDWGDRSTVDNVHQPDNEQASAVHPYPGHHTSPLSKLGAPRNWRAPEKRNEKEEETGRLALCSGSLHSRCVAVFHSKIRSPVRSEPYCVTTVTSSWEWSTPCQPVPRASAGVLPVGPHYPPRRTCHEMGHLPPAYALSQQASEYCIQKPYGPWRSVPQNQHVAVEWKRQMKQLQPANFV